MIEHWQAAGHCGENFRRRHDRSR